MRHLLVSLFVLAAALAMDSGQTAEAAWCASYRNGGTNCGFQTIDQCRATVSGIGGVCVQDYSDQPAARRAPAAAERTRRTERPVRNVETKSLRSKKSREAVRHPAPPAEPSRTTPVQNAPAFAIGDDEHIVPAEPEDTPPTQQAAISETNIPPAATAGERSSRFIAARDLVLRGNYQAGLAALQNLNPETDPDVAAYTGYAYSKLGRSADAKQWYEKALALDPNHLWALSYYGLLMVEEGNLRAARENLDKIKTACGGAGCYAYTSLQSAIAKKR